jgi:hypothetical protein
VDISSLLQVGSHIAIAPGNILVPQIPSIRYIASL